MFEMAGASSARSIGRLRQGKCDASPSLGISESAPQHRYHHTAIKLYKAAFASCHTNLLGLLLLDGLMWNILNFPSIVFIKAVLHILLYRTHLTHIEVIFYLKTY